jgi:phosphoenolpyruvate synthase/pyruvate phosphate dikinase
LGTAEQTKLVYDFSEGSRGMRELLGGKGAGVAEMTRVLGAERVPAGFTITTEACVAYMESGRNEPDASTSRLPTRLDGSRSWPASVSGTRRTRCSYPFGRERESRCRE